MQDAMAAVEAGADALGFVFAESPRRVDALAVSAIVEELPDSVLTVGVFAGQSVDQVIGIMERTDLNFMQVHGTIDLALADSPWGIMRAVRVKSADDIEAAKSDPLVALADAVVLDSHVEGVMGGSGRTFDWDLAVNARALGKPIVLAGGLTPDNVVSAIRRVSPYAVDVSSGVEISPGKKDHEKIREFIRNVRECE